MASVPEDRLVLARRLASLTGRRKVDALLDAPDPKALVRSLPAEDLFFMIQEVGLQDAAELVQLASPGQFRTFTDLDCWRRDQFFPRALLPWLQAADDDEEGFGRKLASLDLEQIELLLREGVEIWEIEEDMDREATGTPWRSPEGRYMVDFKLDGDDGQTMRRVVETYYQRNPLEAVRFLEAVRWEMPSELEEIALRFRNARLADLGFPELEQALKLYAYSDPDAPLGGELLASHEAAGFFLETLGSRSFLDTALEHLRPDDLTGLDRELLGVFNGALVADGVDPSDLDGVRRSLAAARDHLSLGLEYAAKGDAEQAVDLLNTVPVSRIFQVASGLTLRRKFRADRIMATGRAGYPGARHRCWFDAPLGRALEALRKKRPRFDAALESADGSVRPFRARRDLEVVDAALVRAEALASLVGKLGIDAIAAEALARSVKAAEFADVTLAELVLHQALRSSLGLGDAYAPFTLSQLPAVLEHALTPSGTLAPALGEALRRRLEAEGLDAAEREVGHELAEFMLDRLGRELPSLRGSELDPALLGSSALLFVLG